MRQAQQRLSIGGRKSIVPVAKLAERTELNNAIRTLGDFLVNNNYNGVLNAKTLSKPSTKDFNNIATFIFVQLDPHYTCSGKIEDEILRMFKLWGYPNPIAKSCITAVGSPHAWITLLSALVWLIDLIKHNENTYDEEIADKELYAFTTTAYGMFLTGRDDELKELEEKFMGAFLNQNTAIKEQFSNVQQENQLMTAEISRICSRDNYRQELTFKKSKLTEELRKREASTECIKGELNKLLSSKQKQSHLEDAKIVNIQNRKDELSSIRESIEATVLNKKLLQNSIKDLETQLRSHVQALQTAVSSYQSCAEGLKLIPATACNAHGQDLNIIVDIQAKKREGLLKSDVNNHIIPSLQAVRLELTETSLALRSELMTVRETAEELATKRIQLLDNIAEEEDLARKADATYKREKEAMDQSISIHSAELDSMERRLLKLRDTAGQEARITASKRRTTELNALRVARKQDSDRKKSAMIENVMEVISRSAQLREYVQQQLEDLKVQYTSRLHTFFQNGGINGTNGCISGSSDNMEIYSEVANYLFTSSSRSKKIQTMTKLSETAAAESAFLSQYFPSSSAYRMRLFPLLDEMQETAGNSQRNLVSTSLLLPPLPPPPDTTASDRSSSSNIIRYHDIYPQDSAFKGDYDEYLQGSNLDDNYNSSSSSINDDHSPSTLKEKGAVAAATAAGRSSSNSVQEHYEARQTLLHKFENCA